MQMLVHIANVSDPHFCYLVRKSSVSVYKFSSSLMAFLEFNMRDFAMHMTFYVLLFMLVLLMSLKDMHTHKVGLALTLNDTVLMTLFLFFSVSLMSKLRM